MVRRPTDCVAVIALMMGGPSRGISPDLVQSDFDLTWGDNADTDTVDLLFNQISGSANAGLNDVLSEPLELHSGSPGNFSDVWDIGSLLSEEDMRELVDSSLEEFQLLLGDVETATDTSVDPPMTTGAPACPEPAVARPMKNVRSHGLSYAEKLVCLEELIADPEVGAYAFATRVNARMPNADVCMIRAFRANTLSLTVVLSWLHKLLMERTVTTANEYEALIRDAHNMYFASGIRMRQSIPVAVNNWMKFCIDPLRTHKGPASDIFSLDRSQSGTHWARLAVGPARELLMVELANLKRFPTGRALSDRRAGVVRRIPNPTPRPPIGPQANSASAPKWRGLSDDVKRLCLEIMIEDPLRGSGFLVTRVRSLLPHVSAAMVRNFYTNLIARARIPGPIHLYLLAHGTREVNELLVDGLRRAHPTEVLSLRTHLYVALRTWIKYCIVPILANPGAADQLCVILSDSSVRLMPDQRRALFKELLESLETGGSVS